MINQFITNVSELNFYQLQAIIQNPPRLFMCDFSIENYYPALYQQCNIDYPDTIKKSVTIRQAEFLAGRYIASVALENLGIPVANIAIGKNREPIWPSAVVASLSHNRHSALCLAAHSKSCHAVGVDIERIITAERINDIQKVFCSAEEEALLRQSGLSYLTAMTLLFSAKESLFKAIYPSIQRIIDFDTACITEINPQYGNYTLMLKQFLSTELPQYHQFIGYFYTFPDTVITLCYW